MASEKQLAANRRNAKNSTGPRSAPGKNRASRNAYRHGLSTRMLSIELTRAVELPARAIAGSAADPMTLTLARDVAEAVLELARVRRVKVALIERAARFGRFDLPSIFKSRRDEAAWMIQHFCGTTLWKNRPKFALERLPAMPEEEPQRTVEAMRRIILDLQRLSRFESRAAGRRDRAIR